MNMFHAVIIDDYFVDSDSDHFGQSLAKIESHGTACAKIFQAFSSHSKTTLLPVSSKFEEEITIKKIGACNKASKGVSTRFACNEYGNHKSFDYSVFN